METQHARQNSRHFLVDAHVHFHSCFKKNVFFDAALANFRRGAKELGLQGQPVGCLLFCETADEYHFRQFQETATRRLQARWTFHETGENSSLIACRNGGGRIVLVAGRQVATKEGLEVLALGCATDFPKELTLSEALDAALRSGAIAVVPWGFGKWWFRRGRLVREVVEAGIPGRVFLGDNSGRPRLGWSPKLFSLAESRGILTLPGSDPLPFASQVTKSGSYGFALQGTLDDERPADSLKKLLQKQKTQPRVYGRLEGVAGFCRYQLAMQFKKRWNWL